jgi:O-antigen/teichoic acid export membrane protein
MPNKILFSAFFYVLSQRLWQGLSGLVTTFILILYLSKDYQGWYYTFISISAIYSLFDLGLSSVLSQNSSHFFTKVSWLPRGNISGKDSNKFLQFVSFAIAKYKKLAFIFFILITPLGAFLFFNNPKSYWPLYEWLYPWIFLVFVTSLNLFLIPYLSILEGSGKIKEISKLRFLYSAIGSIITWLFLILYPSLWAVTISPLAALILSARWLFKHKFYFILNSFKKNHVFYNWDKEIWPFQWRVGIVSLSAYLSSQIFTPLLFYISGPVVAGQMGLSLAIANMLGIISQSFIVYRMPEMTKIVSVLNYAYFEKLFMQSFFKSLLMYLFGSFFIIFLYMNYLPVNYRDRFLEADLFSCVLLIVFFNHISLAISMYLRCFRTEPLVWIWMFSFVITFPLAILLSDQFSARGVIFSILIVQLMFSIPFSLIKWSQAKKGLKFL